MKFSLRYKYFREPMTVNCELRRNGNIDIISIMWRGTDVFALLEDYEQIADIGAEAERQSEKYLTVAQD